MLSLPANRKWLKLYLFYWAGYLLIFSAIQGLPSNDFGTAFINELISLAPKVIFVALVTEWLMGDLFNKKGMRFALLYVLLLVVFALFLRLIDNYIILKYFLTYWKKESLVSAPPFLYNAIKLQFLVTIPFAVKLFNYRSLEKANAMQTETPYNQPGIGADDVPGAFLYLKCERRMVRVMLADVAYFEAQGNYIFIYLGDKVLKTYMAISDLEAKLPAEQFTRIHRSFIIALNTVESYTSGHVIIGGKKIPIGRSYQLKAKNSLQYIGLLAT